MKISTLFLFLVGVTLWGCVGGDDDDTNNQNNNNTTTEFCTAGDQCDSGFCSDGVCCETACDGLCESCLIPGSMGSCTPIPDGENHNGECSGAGDCAGTCDGQGGCRYPGAETACGAPECNATVYTELLCNGAGTCDATDLDCAGLATDCMDQACDPAVGCVAMDEAAGTPCGDANDSACDAADSCDGEGLCAPNLTPDGVWCTGCSAADGECACESGACGDCTERVSVNTFTTAESINGWQQTGTGGWGLYLEAPGNRNEATPIPFGSQVFGIDGNREPPYPGGHTEEATMVTSPALVPATIAFDSWHMDEGGNSGGEGEYDLKRISLTVDGGQTWHVLVDCFNGPNETLPFCSELSTTRSATDWDPITLDASPFAGQLGQLQFWYSTGDGCCDFERGWFIDNLTFGAGCACVADADCATQSTTCGAAVCNTTSGACEYSPAVEGTPCGDTTSSSCDNADQCDGQGYCSPNPVPTLTPCYDCPAGPGNCWGCSDGICQDPPGGG